MAIDTLTDIANQALQMVGMDSIADIDTNTAPASRIKVLVQGVIDEVLAKVSWHELQQDVSLVARPSKDWKERFIYDIPVDYHRLIEISADDFQVIGRTIRTKKEAPITLLYLRRTDNVGEWSTHLKQCVYHLLAARISISLLGDSQRANGILGYYAQRVLPEALVAQAQDSGSTELLDDDPGDWVRAMLRDEGGIL